MTTKLSLDMYLSADAKTKARIRADIKAATDAAVRNGDFAKAQEMVTLSDEIKAASATPKSTFDADAAMSDLAATLEAAAAHLRMTGQATQPGTVDAKRFESLTKPITRKAGRGDVIAWIASVVDDTPATIATLRGRWVATEDYPEQAPSSGAIGAAFARIEAGAEAPFTVVQVDGKAGAVA